MIAFHKLYGEIKSARGKGRSTATPRDRGAFMASIDPIKSNRLQETAGHQWSHRRSAVLVLAAGALFWLVVFFILLR